MIQKLAVSLRLKTGIGEIVMANNECRKLPIGIQSFKKSEKKDTSMLTKLTWFGNWRTKV